MRAEQDFQDLEGQRGGRRGLATITEKTLRDGKHSEGIRRNKKQSVAVPCNDTRCLDRRESVPGLRKRFGNEAVFFESIIRCMINT